MPYFHLSKSSDSENITLCSPTYYVSTFREVNESTAYYHTDWLSIIVISPSFILIYLERVRLKIHLFIIRGIAFFHALYVGNSICIIGTFGLSIRKDQRYGIIVIRLFISLRTTALSGSSLVAAPLSRG